MFHKGESVDWDFPVSVLDVVLMGRYGHAGWLKRISKKDRTIAHECLEKVNMSPFADRQIGKTFRGAATTRFSGPSPCSGK
jgi:manganese/zinc/iron transport system ATP- binding protein